MPTSSKQTKINPDSAQDFKTYWVKLPLLVLFMIRTHTYICVYIFSKVGGRNGGKRDLDLLINSKLKKKINKKTTERGTPWWSSGWENVPPVPGARVQSLVGEPGSHTPRGVAQTIKYLF